MVVSAALPGALVPVGLAMVFLAGLIRFTGFGFSIAAVPLLSLIMPPAQAVPVVLFLQLLVSLNGLPSAIRICDWRSIRILAAGAVIATPLSAMALARLPAAPVRFGIAAIVLVAVLVLSGGFRMKTEPPKRHTFPFGILSGLFNGLAGMPGPPVIAFYLAAPIRTDIARASMIVFFLATSIFALVPLAAFGMIHWWSLAAAATSFPLVWLGSTLGAYLYRASPEAHYRLVALGLLVTAAALAAVRAAVAFGP
jgi:uncharacterized membrane protein YfcA